MRNPYEGAWTEQEHRDHYVFDQKLSDCYCFQFMECKSVLDIGCGLGSYLKPFKARGAEVAGIEPSINKPIDGVQIFGLDPTDPSDQTALPRPKWDLVICQEVAEHVPLERHKNLFDFVVSKALRYIAFSGAVPAQGGDGHCAERPESEWLLEFCSRNWVPDYEKTAACRREAEAGWFKNNIVVLRPALMRVVA